MWRNFKLAPEIVTIEEVDLEMVQKVFVTQNEKYKLNPYTLTTIQQQQLCRVIQIFNAFEDKGLGRTSLEEHTFKLVEGTEPVKERHYPIYPVVQKIVYEEINNMLKLNVIANKSME